MGIDPDRLIPPAQQLDSAPDYELWPEHWQAWSVYLGCRTQWRKSVGFSAVIWEGLDYQAVDFVMAKYRVPKKQHSEVFAQLQVLELETLAIRNKN